MSKNMIFKVLLALVAVAVAVLFLLSRVMPDYFGFFNLSWAIFIFAAACGVVFILKGIFQKNVGVIKKVNIFFGAALLIVALIALVGAIAIPQNLVLPIIIIVATVALLLSILVVGGKKWDHGDNQNVGYKNYYERKKEEEEAKKNGKDE